MAPNLLEQIRSAWIRHGWRKFARLVVKNIATYPTRTIRRLLHGSSAFDRKYGIETDAIVGTSAFGINPLSESSRHANWYEPTDVAVFEHAISSLSIDYRNYTFVDYGSGKGRALILAAQKPFKEVIGVEFSPRLHAAAEQNIVGAKKAELACSRVRSICCDAVEFEPPEGPLVCFFYNPFTAAIMRQVVGRLCDSLNASPRSIIIVYVNPRHIDEIEKTSRFDLVEKNHHFALFQSVLATGADLWK